MVYTQNFVSRKGATKQGARFIGYIGTVEFDFYTGVINLYYHNKQKTETHTFDLSGNHFGGDSKLVNDFADVVKGKIASPGKSQIRNFKRKHVSCGKKICRRESVLQY